MVHVLSSWDFADHQAQPYGRHGDAWPLVGLNLVEVTLAPTGYLPPSALATTSLLVARTNNRSPRVLQQTLSLNQQEQDSDFPKE